MGAIPNGTGKEIVRRDGERAGQLTFFARPRGPGAAVAFREFFHATGGIDKLLLAGEKWMAGGANTDSNVTTGRAGLVNRAARANHIGLVVFWMNACFHVGK
jgi:hypothetical protein